MKKILILLFTLLLVGCSRNSDSDITNKEIRNIDKAVKDRYGKENVISIYHHKKYTLLEEWPMYVYEKKLYEEGKSNMMGGRDFYELPNESFSFYSSPMYIVTIEMYNENREISIYIITISSDFNRIIRHLYNDKYFYNYYNR